MTGVVVEPEQPPIVGIVGSGSDGVGYMTDSEKATERLLKKIQQEDEELLVIIEAFVISNN